ncbi:hypothetical protein ACFL35_01355 [Candidatus Riflebacteria bacterium]
MKGICYLLLLLFFLLIILYLYENRNPQYIILNQPELNEYITSLTKNGLPPQEYVLKKFNEHQVVILGEPHRVKQHYDFLKSLIEPLARSGIKYIGIEFYSVSIQDWINKLLTGREFDVALARKIILSDECFFFYQELYDVFYEAWKVNRKGYEMHIIALEPEGGAFNHTKDRFMAQTASKIVAKKEKILIYCGTHHAFTRYYQPSILFWNKPTKVFRMGQFLLHKDKSNPFFIFLHHPLSKRFWLFCPILLYRQGFSLPFSGIVDQVFAKYKKPAGFDTSIEKFKKIPDSFSYYSSGYGTINLTDFADGYIFLNNYIEDNFVTPLENICSSKEEVEYLISILDENDHHLFVDHKRALRFLKSEGLTPAFMKKAVDIRGLEEFFSKN